MSTTKFVDTINTIQQLHPWDVPVNPEVQTHIINLFNTIHGSGGEAFCERESRYINRAIVDDQKKWNVTPLSVYLAFVELAVKNLTLEPGAQAMCYLLHRGQKLTGSDGKDYWENRCYIAVTGYGEILLRQRAGQIRHCDTPTIVYEGDEFGYIERDGRKNVTYGLNLGHNPGKPIACFMKITRIDGSIDYAIILPEAWARLSKFSEKQNQGRVNPLYNAGLDQSIDPGFLIAKCVKHAFKNYPKLPVGKGMVMQAELPDEEAAPGSCPTDTPVSESPSTSTPAAQPDSFSPPADLSAGVTIDPEKDNDSDGTW
jgi:hypothetical protein